LLALEAGLREGEIIALPWKNVHFAQRYIWVARRWYEGAYGLPKGNKKRRVDMSLEIGRALGELRDQRMLKAFQMGRETIADDLVFPGQRGEPLSVWAMVKNHFRPTLKRAGLGHFRFHELRHTFGSILIQSGSSLPYVKDQMGHSTIQITVDTYCHLIAGRNVGLLDKAFPVRSSATRTQPAQPDEVVESLSYSNQSMFLVGRDQMDKLPISTPTADSKELQPLSALKSDKKQQKAQPGRNPDGGEL
jgi:integrase